MAFRKLIKTIDTSNYNFEMIDPKKIKAQYNPDRFQMWKSLHEGPKGEELNMIYSPHYRFLKGNREPYWRLQKMYGRNNKWVKNKISKFIEVMNNIKRNGFLENISAVEIPLVDNKYNKGFEIFEGHHRVSIALFLELELIPCEIIRRNK